MKTFYRLILPAMLAPGFLSACSAPSPSDTDTSAEAAGALQETVSAVAVESPTPNTETHSHEGTDHDADNHSHDEDDAVRSADAHVHGSAELAVAVEDNLVIVELESPLYNIVGFENTPETDAQKAAVKTAETKLSQGQRLFSFNAAAQCEYQAKDEPITLFSVMSDGDSHDHHGEDHAHDHDHADEHDHAHDDHAHDKDHNHTHEDSADKDHSHGDHHDHAHKDVVLQYSYMCKDSSQLSEMTVRLFEPFENMSDLDVVYLGPATQKLVNLNRNETKVDLTP